MRIEMMEKLKDFYVFHNLFTIQRFTLTYLQGLMRCRLILNAEDIFHKISNFVLFVWSGVEILEDQVLKREYVWKSLEKESPDLCWLGSVSCES